MRFFSVFFALFSKLSAILRPRTMKFGQIKYFYTKKWHKKNYRKISIFRAFFRCFFYTQIQKWCVCSRFPQPLNIRAAWNLEFKSKLDQLEKKWKPFFKIRIFTPFYGNFSIFWSFFRFFGKISAISTHRTMKFRQSEYFQN